MPGGKHYRPAKGASVHGDANGTPWRGEKHADFDDTNQPDVEDKVEARKSKAIMRAYLETKRMAAAKKLAEIIEMDEKTALQLAAVNTLFDRLDGKPNQSVSGVDGEPLPNVMNVRFVKPE